MDGNITMQTTVIGLLGPTMDNAGKGASRWERWRPSVALCQQDDLLVQRFELLYQTKFQALLDRVVKDIRRVSPETKVIPHKVEFPDPWDFETVYASLHDFTRSYSFDIEQEQYLVHITTGSHVAQICLFLLTEANYFPARLLQTGPKAGRTRHPDPRGEYRIIDLDLSKYDRIAMRFRREMDDDISFLKSGIETRNQAFNNLIERIERVALHSLDPLLLTGPTGAGKSRLARRIFELKLSHRQLKGPFVEVNCATLRGDAAMSALFGHKKGAFTGAMQDRQGLLRTADKGMLFLDEVGELGLDEQSMLLRAIEEKRFLPVGADMETGSQFQLICGTNRDLQASVAEGRFREDLLSRINLWTFQLPGLADRPEDIQPNLAYELDRFAERHHTRVTFNKEARNHFLSFATSTEARWTANFRDLNGAVTRMATLSYGGRITQDNVAEEIARLKDLWQGSERDEGDRMISKILGGHQAAKLDRFDRVQLADVLKVCHSCRTLSEAGRRLFAVSRTRRRIANDADRLRKYLARFDLSWKDLTNQDGQ
jgi:transcriptional regulatory protein RtcR